jgi:hypothetical protein
MGVTITPDRAFYSVEELEMTSYADEPMYAAAVWAAYVPDYVDEDHLELSPNIERVRLLREKNVALIFAALAKGDNTLKIHSRKPSEYIKIEEQQLSGTRYEIYIRNNGPAVQVSNLETFIDSRLRVGGFWWNGKYHQSLSHYHSGHYDWRTGELAIRTAYPIALELPTGLSRVSIEVIGRMDAGAGRQGMDGSRELQTTGSQSA